MDYAPCVGSGMCCKKAPCGYGEWNADRTQCAHLVTEHREDGFEIYRCGRYEYIVKQPGAEFMPAFGAGCCMSLFNENRAAIINAVQQGNVHAKRILQLRLQRKADGDV